jgi:hypothetical protein
MSRRPAAAPRAGTRSPASSPDRTGNQVPATPWPAFDGCAPQHPNNGLTVLMVEDSPQTRTQAVTSFRQATPVPTRALGTMRSEEPRTREIRRTRKGEVTLRTRSARGTRYCVLEIDCVPYAVPSTSSRPSVASLRGAEPMHRHFRQRRSSCQGTMRTGGTHQTPEAVSGSCPDGDAQRRRMLPPPVWNVPRLSSVSVSAWWRVCEAQWSGRRCGYLASGSMSWFRRSDVGLD